MSHASNAIGFSEFSGADSILMVANETGSLLKESTTCPLIVYCSLALSWANRKEGDAQSAQANKIVFTVFMLITDLIYDHKIGASSVCFRPLRVECEKMLAGGEKIGCGNRGKNRALFVAIPYFRGK